MKTLTLEQAAAYLIMSPDTVRKKAAKGEIKGAKPGKRWCFRENDLDDYLESLYSIIAETSQGVLNRRTLWHSTKEVTRGGLPSVTKGIEYRKLVGLPTR